VRIALHVLILVFAPRVGVSPPAAPPEADTVRRLVAALKDADPEVRQNLAIALAKIGPAAVEPLVAALKDPLPERRAGAAAALGQIGAPARPALPALLDLLDDKELDVRRQVSHAIARLIPSSRPERRAVRAAPAGGTP
jgi:HEAT repeat protein